MADHTLRWAAVSIAATLAGAWILVQSSRDRPLRQGTMRGLALLLAGLAAWVGWTHQWVLMAPLNFMAPLYALGWWGYAVWIVARLWFWTPPDASHAPALTVRIGQGLLAVALIGYPLLQWGLGVPILAGDLVGTGPNATALLILGVLLATVAPHRPDLLVFPTLWAWIAGLHGYLLDFRADYSLPVLASLALGVAVLAVRRDTPR